MEHRVNQADFIELDHVFILLDGEATVTRIKADAAQVRATNSGDAYQQQIAEWVGCPGDIPRYNFEHEFIHSFICQKMHGGESYVIEREARFGGRMNKGAGLLEERWCYHFHQWMNGMRQDPLEPEWERWRVEAWVLLGRNHIERVLPGGPYELDPADFQDAEE